MAASQRETLHDPSKRPQYRQADAGRVVIVHFLLRLRQGAVDVGRVLRDGASDQVGHGLGPSASPFIFLRKRSGKIQLGEVVSHFLAARLQLGWNRGIALYELLAGK